MQSGVENTECRGSQELVTPTLSESPMPLLSPPSNEVRSRKRKRKDNAEVEDAFLMQAKSTLELLGSTSAQPQQNDTWDTFGKFVAETLRSMNKNQIKCKHEIQNVMMKYEEDNLDE